jgi:hypothetical protein
VEAVAADTIGEKTRGSWGSEATNNAWPLPNLEELSHLCSQEIVGMLMKEMTVKLSDL